MALDVSSVPLSLTIVAGLARQPMIASSARDASPADRGVGHQRQTLAGAVVVHLQDPEPAPVGELVGDEVETPALVGDRGCLYRPPRSHGPLAPAALANHQPLLAIQTLNALFVGRMALAPQQHMQPPIAEPPPLLGQGLQPLAKFAVIRPPGLVAHAGPIAVNHPARPPLAHLIGLLQISRSLPMRGGRHHFFPSRSFNATLSSMASASIRFSLAFSSSSAFNRRASDTSSPPNLAFHLSKVGELSPCLRHRSITGTPDSCSRKIPMIC